MTDAVETFEDAQQAALVHLSLPARAELECADQLRNQLQECQHAGTPVVIDASDVTLVDTRVLQVLLAADAAPAAMACRFHVTASSPALVEAMASLGLSDRLQEWENRNV